MAQKFDRSLLPPAPDFYFELTLWAQGVKLVAGVDEAGRGALAGPVAVGALVFPPDPALSRCLVGVRDSKQMTPGAREVWAIRLPELSLAYSVGYASNQEIDTLGILPATRLAASRAVQQLPVAPEHLLVDFLRLPDCSIPQTPLVKGDQRSLSIAAASVLAKTARDALLRQLDAQYPGYDLAVHKGYGTPGHYRALARLGPSSVHRRTFNLRTGLETVQ